MNIRSVILFMFIFPIFLFSQPKETIAVLELDPIGVKKSDARIITSRLRTYLVNTNKFVVLEREKMHDVLKEQGFQLTGCTTNECLVEVGQLLNVKKIIAGSIGKIGNLYTISIRLIDIETGRIIKTAASDCDCSIEEVLIKSVPSVLQALINDDLNNEYIRKIEGQENNKMLDLQKLNLSQDDYIDFKNSNLNFDDWLNYKHEKKDYFIPVVLSIIPGIAIHGMGNFAAGNIKAGTILLLTEIGGIIYGYNTGDANVGFYLFYGTLIFDIISTPIYIYNYNIKLKNKYNISFIPNYQNKNISLSINIVF